MKTQSVHVLPSGLVIHTYIGEKNAFGELLAPVRTVCKKGAEVIWAHDPGFAFSEINGKDKYSLDFSVCAGVLIATPMRSAFGRIAPKTFLHGSQMDLVFHDYIEKLYIKNKLSVIVVENNIHNSYFNELKSYYEDSRKFIVEFIIIPPLLLLSEVSTNIYYVKNNNNRILFIEHILL